MKLFYKILRGIIVGIILCAVTIPALLFVALSIPAVQDEIGRIAQRELSALLGARVEIGDVSLSPFNRAMLNDVVLTVNGGRDTVMTAERISGGINLMELVRHRRIVVDYAEVIGLNASISRRNPADSLNIQPIIVALTKRPPRNQAVQLAINTVLIRNSSLSYDILSEPFPNPGRFSPAHVRIYDLNADFVVPTVGKTEQYVKAKRMKFKEVSGLEITDLKGTYIMSPSQLSVEGLTVEMPGSRLAFSDVAFEYGGETSLTWSLCNTPLVLTLSPDSHITPADLSPLVPILADIRRPAEVEFAVEGTINGESTVTFDVYDSADMYSLAFNTTLINPLDSLHRRVEGLTLSAGATAEFISGAMGNEPGDYEIVDSTKYVTVDIGADLTDRHIDMRGEVSTGVGSLLFDAVMDNYMGKTPAANIELAGHGIDLGHLLPGHSLGMVSFTASGNGELVKGIPSGELALAIDTLDWQGSRLNGITLEGSYAPDGGYELTLTGDDPVADFELHASGDAGRAGKSLQLRADVEKLGLALTGIVPQNPGSILSLTGTLDLSGRTVDDIRGTVDLRDITLADPDGNRFVINSFNIEAIGDAGAPDRLLTLKSDIIDAEVSGRYYFSTLGKQIKALALQSFPVIREHERSGGTQAMAENNFTYGIEIKDTDDWTERMNYSQLPVSILGKMTVKGAVNYPDRSLRMNLDLPYLRQGIKLIDSTQVTLSVDGASGRSLLYATTNMPTKQGMMRLNLQSDASHDKIGSRLWWKINRSARYEGDISLKGAVDIKEGHPCAAINLLPGEATFNDSTWTVMPATIDVEPGYVRVNDIDVHRAGQFVKIDGTASADSTDVLNIDLLNINLDYVFESLGLTNVLIGGDATGSIYANSLFSSEPRIVTQGVDVKGVSYNGVVLGDAVAKSHWDSHKGAVILDVDIAPFDGSTHSTVKGALYPLTDSLDLVIDAHDVNVAFMKPYMKAFTSDVSGRGTGKVRLMGSFANVDMEGDVYGKDIKLKVDFTNTSYTTSDLIRIRPGGIEIDGATVHDGNGHTARLTGWVKHRYFKFPSFDFKVTDVDGMLVYDESPHTGAKWYGRVYGYGNAHIYGQPGVVNINVNLRTAPGSTFTYVNTDMKEAGNYDFITFRDRDILAMGESEKFVHAEPKSVRNLRDKLSQGLANSSDDYNINLQVDITPQARINMIMDSHATDSIRSNGLGNLGITYQSRNDYLNMVGKYTIEKGKYNFTLQDIIIKEFSIQPGSRIEFNGDPYKAQLDITTALTINANLTDLDESFAVDRELTRTSVPVNAMVMVKGSLQDPEITYGIDFPTLNDDIKRKVNSIISTDEMKSTQIIYLLALERFYTPDYMGKNNNQGSELMSVASATISSQLRSMLGHLADNWTVAPTIRSDKGDFSNVEVEVGLSSSLLNNRLLFNGNFGYRDNTLNSNQFVGDFDIEYLLNPAGTWRLKAYNRFNDQNYYLRSAETTQGVGIVFRRTFDDLRSFLGLRKREKPKSQEVTEPKTPEEKPVEDERQ